MRCEDQEDVTVDHHGEILIYQTEDGLTKIDVNMKDETVWLSLDQMSELCTRDKSTISRQVKKSFAMDDDRLKELGGGGNSYDNGRLGKASGQDFDVHRRKPSHQKGYGQSFAGHGKGSDRV